MFEQQKMHSRVRPALYCNISPTEGHTFLSRKYFLLFVVDTKENMLIYLQSLKFYC